MTSVQKVITNFRRKLREDSWFAGLFDSTRFKGDTSPQSTDLQSIETSVVDTSSIDTYDLVFNLQIPSIAGTPFFHLPETKIILTIIVTIKYIYAYILKILIFLITL